MDNQFKKYIPNYEELFNKASEENEIKKKNGKSNKGLELRIFKRLFKNNAKNIFLSSLFYIIKNSPSWVIPVIISAIINVLVSGGTGAIKKVYIYGAIMFVVILQNIPTHVIHSRYSDRTIRTISAGMRNTLVKKLQQLSITYHKEIETGKIQAKLIRDLEAMEFFDAHFLKSCIPAFIGLTITVCISIYKSGIVSLFFLVVVPVNVFLMRFFDEKMGKNNREFREENEEMSSKLSTMLDMIPVTKAHGLENEEIIQLEKNINSLKEKGLIMDKTNTYFGATVWVVSQTLATICLAFTCFLAYLGKIQVGDVVLFQTLFGQITGNLDAIINIYPELSKGVEAVHSISEVMLSNDIEDNKGKIKLRYVHGTVYFDNCSYRYPKGDRDVVNNLNLHVEKGECIAFVGASGSGKSTVMNMIIGFLKPTGGTLSIDGKPIDMLNLPDYRHYISVVPQTSVMFKGSIRDNILYGLHDVSEEKLLDVVERANINEFLKDMPNGLDTEIGENGSNLSGGQKQRISIARALIRDPKILILDEATSALDNVSEFHVQKAINELIKGRTTFIVAHRLSTIRDADRIVVMENGECVEIGTYDALMEKRGKFFELKSLSEMK